MEKVGLKVGSAVFSPDWSWGCELEGVRMSEVRHMIELWSCGGIIGDRIGGCGLAG